MKFNNWKLKNVPWKINSNKRSTHSIASFFVWVNCFHCRHSWNILQQNLHRIEDEIAVKSNSIMLEKRALETRHRLNTEITPQTEVDRTRQLMNMDSSGIRPVLQSIYWNQTNKMLIYPKHIYFLHLISFQFVYAYSIIYFINIYVKQWMILQRGLVLLCLFRWRRLRCCFSELIDMKTNQYAKKIKTRTSTDKNNP